MAVRCGALRLNGREGAAWCWPLSGRRAPALIAVNRFLLQLEMRRRNAQVEAHTARAHIVNKVTCPPETRAAGRVREGREVGRVMA